MNTIKQVKDLIRCIWYLGFKHGVKYWKLRQLPMDHPDIKRWRMNLLAKAATTSNLKERELYLDFADKITPKPLTA